MAERGEILVSTAIDTSGFETDARKLQQAAQRAADSVNKTFEELKSKLSKKDVLQMNYFEDRNGKGHTIYNDRDVVGAYDYIEANGGVVDSWNDIVDAMRDYKEAAAIAANERKKQTKAAKEEAQVEKKVAKTKVAEVSEQKKATKANNGFGQSLKKGVGTLLKFALGLQALRAIYNKLKQAAKEGINNLVQVDKNLNKSLSTLKSSMTQLKNSIGTMIAPLIQMVEPFITKLIGWLTEAFNKAAELMAALAGQKTFKKAIAVQEDYAAAVAKTQANLSGLDEIKTFDDNNGNANVEDMFMTATIDADTSALAGKITEIIEGIKSAFGEVWEFINTNVAPVIEALINLVMPFVEFIMQNIGPVWETVKGVLDPIIETIGSSLVPIIDGLRTTIDNLLDGITGFFEAIKPVTDWVSKVVVQAFQVVWKWITNLFSMISQNSPKLKSIIETIGRIISKVWKIVEPIFTYAFNLLSAIFEFVMGVIVPTIDYLITYFDGFVKIIEGLLCGDLGEVWEGVKEIFNGWWEWLVDIWEAVKTFFVDAFDNAVEFMGGFWEDIGSGFTEWWKNIKETGKELINKLIRGINSLIDGINKISFSMPDWVPGVGGKSVGFNIKKIPELASGAVIPPNAPFMAMLGDQKRGTNIEAPLDTIKEAVAEVVGSGGTYQFTAQINRRTLFDEIIEEGKVRRTATGRNPFAMA